MSRPAALAAKRAEIVARAMAPLMVAGDAYDELLRLATTAIDAAVADVLKAEREACAKVNP